MPLTLKKANARVGRIVLWVRFAKKTHTYKKAVAGIVRELTLRGLALG